MPRRKSTRGRKAQAAPSDDGDDNSVIVIDAEASEEDTSSPSRPRARPRRGRSPRKGGEEEDESPAPARKKRRGRSTPKRSYKEASSEDEGEEPAPKPRRGRARKKAENEEGEDDGGEEGKEPPALVCPHCEKRFNQKRGLAYHLDKMVCRTDPEDRAAAGKSFPCPNCNQMFVHEKRLALHLRKKVCQGGGKRVKTEDSPSSAGASGKSSSRKQTRPPAKKANPPSSSEEEEELEEDEDDSDEEDSEGGSDSDFAPDNKVAAKGGGGRRKSPRRSTTKKKNRDDDDDDDGSYVDDDDEEEGGDEDSDFDLDDDVVAEPKARARSQTPRRSRKSPARSRPITGKFHKLRKGSKFVTRFGIVEVIADDRLPAVHHKTPADDKAGRNFAQRRQRHRDRTMRLEDRFAAGARSRREELKRLRAEGGSLTQANVWGLYCQSVTPKEILTDGKSWKDRNEEKEVHVEKVDEGDDPRVPRDYYPDRIVECKLIPDERAVVVGKYLPPSDGGRRPTAFETEPQETASTPPAPLRLFLSRRELSREYSPDQTNYICGGCGGQFTDLNYHMKNCICLAHKEEDAERMQQRMEDIESQPLSAEQRADLLTTPHGVIKAPELRSKKGDPPEFGNPHRIKEHKLHKMPPWLVFNADRSSMYPEIYQSLEFRRGSQNRNHFKKLRQEEDYLSARERTRLRKKLRNLRKGSTDVNPLPTASSALAAAVQEATPVVAKKTPPSFSPVATTAKKRKSKPAAKEKKKRAAKKAKAPSLTSSSLPPLPAIDGSDDLIFEGAPDSFSLGDSANETLIANGNKKMAALPSSHNGNDGRRKQILVSKKKGCVVIDTQVLATEIDAGRYPSIKRFEGEHDPECTLCEKPGDESLIQCDYCKNAVHQTCLDKRMLNKDPQVVIRENEPHDTPMCHECIYTCLVRRSRAEHRRLIKWQHELSKAGLEQAPVAANLTEEVNLGKSTGDAAGEAKEGDEELTYKPCPEGGPGGLICCSHCTAAYSRFLSNTAKEMEAQSVARAGQEVSEILELLEDAKQRLQRASDVSQSNEERRGLLGENQGAAEQSLF